MRFKEGSRRVGNYSASVNMNTNVKGMNSKSLYFIEMGDGKGYKNLLSKDTEKAK